MRRILFLITLLVVLSSTYAQNDTLYLEKYYVILRGKKYNQSDSLGYKCGYWIKHETKGSGIIEIVEWDGDLWSGSELIMKQYRPLEANEFYGIRKIVSEKVDSVSRYIEGTYQFVYNKIPSENYYVKAQGKYKNDNKVGEWRYYHENNAISRIIVYNKGIPEQSFDMYDKDGSRIMRFIKLTNGKWELVRYSKEGSKQLTKQVDVEDFSEIY